MPNRIIYRETDTFTIIENNNIGMPYTLKSIILIEQVKNNRLKMPSLKIAKFIINANVCKINKLDS